jgi:hypothetical protein
MLPERFMSKVRVTESGCWEWTGSVHRTGYARFNVGGRSKEAHIVAYEMVVGPVPDGLQLDHRCHDPRECAGGWGCPHRRCVNPAHLKPVTQSENNQRGRSVDRARERARKNRWGNVRVECPVCGREGLRRHRARHFLLHTDGS